MCVEEKTALGVPSSMPMIREPLQLNAPVIRQSVCHEQCGYATLIKLCTDIASETQKKLLWFAIRTKSLIYAPKSDGDGAYRASLVPIKAVRAIGCMQGLAIWQQRLRQDLRNKHRTPSSILPLGIVSVDLADAQEPDWGISQRPMRKACAIKMQAILCLMSRVRQFYQMWLHSIILPSRCVCHFDLNIRKARHEFCQNAGHSCCYIHHRGGS